MSSNGSMSRAARGVTFRGSVETHTFEGVSINIVESPLNNDQSVFASLSIGSRNKESRWATAGEIIDKLAKTGRELRIAGNLRVANKITGEDVTTVIKEDEIVKILSGAYVVNGTFYNRPSHILKVETESTGYVIEGISGLVIKALYDRFDESTYYPVVVRFDPDQRAMRKTTMRVLYNHIRACQPNYHVEEDMRIMHRDDLRIPPVQIKATDAIKFMPGHVFVNDKVYSRNTFDLVIRGDKEDHIQRDLALAEMRAEMVDERLDDYWCNEDDESLNGSDDGLDSDSAPNVYGSPMRQN